MAGIIRNGLLSAARRLSNPTKCFLQTPTASLNASNTRLLSTKLTGSLWQMSNNNVSKTRVHHLMNCKCGCRSYSTDADEEMTNILEDEIMLESEKVLDLPKISSFKVAKLDGSHFELERKQGNETISIEVNVNAAVESAGPAEEGEDEEMICRPDFEVNISKKGSKHVLSIFCMFDKSEDMDEDTDLFIIHSISLYNESNEDATYTLQAENLDEDMYRMFMTYLEDRKLDKDFADELIDFATVYEHQQYLKFLENIKSFVSSK
ncbi:hypothetical protein LOTGIDRAFT_204901 [Lottia gigantea]|uniref:Complement component 1 Q subcomponent-binding protein, mitochondrial n=1 Tax=Lottia gigantea TaxID=225164 RepID=V3YWM6_LOTGI|nr:hypothetical protein LOTGIDRAFT_204901 [Lottia gigantea]ESO82428.1 hypothetical protein LOTGIDRAFT_204901 [Lottia gigantea]